jgi:hypothetical protein
LSKGVFLDLKGKEHLREEGKRRFDTETGTD